MINTNKKARNRRSHKPKLDRNKGLGAPKIVQRGELGKKLVVVLGMHRSGTSAITRGLKVLGIDLGDHLIPTMEGVNEKGFWEDVDINSFNIEILRELNTDWFNLTPIEAREVNILRDRGYTLRAATLLQQKVSQDSVFGIKDPRLAKLLPFWKEVFDHCKFDIYYLIAVRHPLSVVKSLASRDALDPTLSYLIWLEHVITSVFNTDGYKRVLVDYDSLMLSPEYELSRIAKSFNLEINSKELQYYTSEFLDSSLQHTLYHQRDLLLDSKCPQLVQKIYSTLVDISFDHIDINESAVHSKITQWKNEFNDLKPFLVLVDSLTFQIKDLSHSVTERNGQLKEKNALIAQTGKELEDAQAIIEERDGQLKEKNALIAQTGKELEDAQAIIEERDGQLKEKNELIAQTEKELEGAKATVENIFTSNTWNITKPLRWTGRVLRGNFQGAFDPFRRKPASCSNLQTKTKRTVPKFSAIKEFPIKPTHPVAVILPVYRDVEMTKRCILAAMPDVLNIENAKLVAINDASPDIGMQAMLEEFTSTWPEVFTVLENKNNLGFVQTVNRGFDYFLQYDVVLLNSDVIVPVDWLSRLRNEAYLTSNIGTVTPFSNNATICSFPYFLQENCQPLSLDVDSIDAVFKLNKLACVTAPTGVGFCMYIRRACLDDIGYLNYEKFGRGYGEENDLCQRALKQGWLNSLSPNIYAYHEGGVSFSSDKQALVDRAMKVIDELHPNYHADIQKFVKEDPLKFARVTRHLQLLSETTIPKVIHISHGLGGGVAQHVEELAEFFDQDVVHLILTPYEGDSAVSISLGVDPHADTLVFSILSGYDDMLQLLQAIGVSSIHFHHTVNLSSKILELPHDLGVPHILTVHDFYWLNGNPTLTDESGRYPGHYSDELINPLYPLPEGVTVEEFRTPLRQLFNSADKIIFPSNATKLLFANVYPLENALVAHHVELKREISKAPIPFIKKDEYIIGVLGALSREKGADLLEKMAVIARKAKMPFKFKLLGYAYRPIKAVETTGPYSQTKLAQMLQQHEVDIVFFPAQWPETYSYTLSYALESGVPIIATDLGAFPERLSGRKNSLLFDHHTPTKALIDQLILFIDALAAGREVNAPEFNGDESKSDFYESIYLAAVSSGLKQTGLTQQSKSILLKSTWGINQSVTDAGWRETILTILWHSYMHPSTSWLGRLIPSSTRRFIRQFLSHRPVHDLIKPQERKKS